MAHAGWRWAGAGGVAVLIGATLVLPSQAGNDNLPDKTPAELIAMVAGHDVAAFSGTLEQTSALGLPNFGEMGSSSTAGMASALELLTGSHTARLYVGGPELTRVQILDQLAERDVVRNGSNVWVYGSADNTATHLTVPVGSPKRPEATTMPTPATLAAEALAAMDPTTTLSTAPNIDVAGRSAYELVLTPKAAGTLIGAVVIAIDAQTGMPLGVDVRALGQQDPAFHVAFTSLDLSAPPAARFEFTPPAGATVKQETLPAMPAKDAKEPANDHGGPQVIGTGWDAVLEFPIEVAAAGTQDSGGGLVSLIATPVAGGRAITTALVSVLLTDDGRVLAGSVPVERLVAAASGK